MKLMGFNILKKNPKSENIKKVIKVTKIIPGLFEIKSKPILSIAEENNSNFSKNNTIVATKYTNNRYSITSLSVLTILLFKIMTFQFFKIPANN